MDPCPHTLALQQLKMTTKLRGMGHKEEVSQKGKHAMFAPELGGMALSAHAQTNKNKNSILILKALCPFIQKFAPSKISGYTVPLYFLLVMYIYIDTKLTTLIAIHPELESQLSQSLDFQMAMHAKVIFFVSCMFISDLRPH